MKKFIEKNKVLILVVSLIALFVALSVLIKDKNDMEEADKLVTEWYTTTKEGGTVVTVLAQTTCSHCINFKPVMEKAQKEYGFKLYWFELDKLSVKSRNTLEYTYDLYDSFGTPYIFVTKNGEFINDYKQGEMPEADLITFLKDNGVIENTKKD